MRVLCVCQKGNSRSVALAWLLKKEYKIDAIAVGIMTSSESTLNMLYGWADVIILTSAKYRGLIPDAVGHKLKLWHVGTDIWFQGFAPDLIDKYKLFIEKEGFHG